MTTIKLSIPTLIGVCFFGFVDQSAAQTPQRTSNGLVVKSTSKLSPPQATLAKLASQKVDAKVIRARQEREMAQQMNVLRSNLSPPNGRQRMPTKSAASSRVADVKSK